MLPLVLALALALGETAVCASAAEYHVDSQTHAGPPLAVELCGEPEKAPLGLPRLAGRVARTGENVPKPNRSEVVDLAAEARSGHGLSLRTRGAVEYMEITSQATWARNLRPLRDGLSYTTFTVLASLGTVIEIDGAVIGLQPSRVRDYAALMVGRDDAKGRVWEPLHHEITLVLIENRTMGMLTLYTIRTEGSTWSLYLRDHLLAENLPRSSGRGGRREFTITAGSDGVWICGIASSDDNPVFEDENHNAIPDVFERSAVGRLLSDGDSKATFLSARAAWGERQLEAPASFWLQLPVPDVLLHQPDHDGGMVHDMPDSIKLQ